MIDTDKYTGHTPVREEWPRWCEDWLFSVYADDGSHIPNWNQDNNLACDAPLLLEEVKRLRGLLKITAQSYLDDVRAEDMLGEVSVKKEYETCQEIADVLGVSIEFGRYFVYLDEDGEMVMMND